MPTILLSYVTKFFPWLIGLVGLAGFLFYVHYLRHELYVDQKTFAEAQSTIAQLSAVNKQNLTTLKVLKAENVAWQTTLSTTLAGDDTITRFSESIIQSIASSPSANDASVAPVLAGTLASISKGQGEKQ